MAKISRTPRKNISGNLYLGAVNAFEGYEVGYGKILLTGETQTFPEIAKSYHEANQPWVVIGDENMGEGSSREHAAMEPRFRLGLVAIARSFARIHETNLKKQGMLPLTFSDPTDYDKIDESDRLSVRNLTDLSPGKELLLTSRNHQEKHLTLRQLIPLVRTRFNGSRPVRP